MWLDTLIAIVVVLALILAIISRLTKQTIPELLSGIADYLGDRKEGIKEATTERYLG